MSQASQGSSVPTEAEKQFPDVEDWFLSDWFFKVMIPAVFLLLIVGTVVLL